MLKIIGFLFIFQILTINIQAEQCENPLNFVSTIHEQLILFDQPLTIQDHHCTQYTLPINYKQAEIIVTSTRIKHLMITDVPITKCSELSFNECPQDSTICMRSINNAEKVTKQKVGLCLQKLYVNILLDCGAPEGEVNGTVLIEMDNSSPCNPIKDTEEIQCAGIPEYSCGNTDRELCQDHCFWTKCQISNGNQGKETVFGACIPTLDYKEEDQREACRTSYEWAVREQENKQETSVNPQWCGGIAPSHTIQDVKDKVNSMNWWESILALIIVLIMLFCCTVCLYRYELATNKFPPFNPPDFCPDVIFPRVNPIQLEQIETITQQRYQKPDEFQMQDLDEQEQDK